MAGPGRQHDSVLSRLGGLVAAPGARGPHPDRGPHRGPGGPPRPVDGIGAPGRRTLIGASRVARGAAVALSRGLETPDGSPGGPLADAFSSAALLGGATTAMLMGHSYLIAPAMSLRPLLRLLIALVAAIML